MTKRMWLLALASMLGLAGVSAGQTVYFGDDNPRGALTNSFAARASFFAALNPGQFQTNDIEGLAAFTFDPVLAFPALGINVATDVEFVGDEAPTPFYSISGTKVLFGRNDGFPPGGLPNLPNVFTMSTPVTAFGFFMTEVGDLANDTTLTLQLENIGLATSKFIAMGSYSGRQPNAAFFFGVTDTTPFDRVTIHKQTAGNANDGVTFDDITVGFASVPEPGTMALAGLAALGLGALQQRRSRRWRSGK